MRRKRGAKLASGRRLPAAAILDRYALMLFSRTTWPQVLTCLAKNV
jgi:hypothetical protein